MFTDEGNFERGRLEALEGREAIERLARIEAETASAVRNRLEKGSPSAGRRNFAATLNEMVADAAARDLPGLDAIAKIRAGQRHGYKTHIDHNRAYERFERAAGGEGFNRLHPKSRRIGDAAGSFASSDARARDHWPSGGVEGIEPEFLLDVARMLIEAVRARRRD